MDTVQFSLARDEVEVYDAALNLAGYDPQLYRSSQLVECPPEHYAEVAFVFSTDEILHGIADGDNDVDRSYYEVIEAALDICEKFARVVGEEGLDDRAEEAVEDFGRFPMKPPEEFEEEQKYGGNVRFSDRLASTYRYMLECNSHDSRVEVIRDALVEVA